MQPSFLAKRGTSFSQLWTSNEHIFSGRSLNKGLGTRKMSYETCESAGEKTIELDQDNRKNGGEGGRREGQTKEPLRKLGGDQLDPASPRGASTAHESNAPRPS